MKDWNSRLEALERTIKSAADSPIWIIGENDVVRVNIGHRHGQPVEFDSIYDARVWIEKQISKHPAGGIIDYHADCICDLYENAEEMKAMVRSILPETIILQSNTGRVIGGQVQPTVIDVDHLPATLALQGIPPGGQADLCLWSIATLMEYFHTVGFSERFKTRQINDGDNALFTVLFMIYSWGRDDEPRALLIEFIDLFYQVTRFTKPDAAEISEAISEGQTA